MAMDNLAEWVKSFYRSAVWLHKRSDILKRDNHECQKHKERGRFAPATCVHHIKHLKEFPELALNDENLISLCDICHNEEHPEKLHKNTQQRKIINCERW